ncbi:MAG: ATP-binding protein [Bacteroidales bacterium]|nr:ATP-binding protein [Bacteroidales bacterium]
MSVFLFGARQTGKSTLLRKAVSKAVYIDLLDSDIRKLYRKRPAYLYDQLAGKDSSCVVIIDEIPEVPDLLNEVHRLISEFGIRFVLCGSSARKLKRKGYNTLGGRAFPCYFYPLVSAEIPDLDIDRAVNNGMMPLHYPSKNATRLLASYVDVYLKEEIQAEALVRDLDNFERFLEVAALTDGEMVNYANIASDCGVSAKTVKEYFSILQDTLVGYTIPAYTKVMKRRLVQAPRFYFFDVGVANYLLHRQNLVRGTVEYGHAFEHWVIQEIIAYIGYTHNENRLSYWRTYTGIEVDAVIGDARLAIEIKSVAEVLPKHLTGLKTFMEEHPDTRPIIVSLDRISRRCGEMEALYVLDFLRMLWAGELF